MTRIAPESQFWSVRRVLNRLTLHQIVVLSDLFRRPALLDVREQGHEDVLGERSHIGLSESAGQLNSFTDESPLTEPAC